MESFRAVVVRGQETPTLVITMNPSATSVVRVAKVLISTVESNATAHRVIVTNEDVTNAIN